MTNSCRALLLLWSVSAAASLDGQTPPRSALPPEVRSLLATPFPQTKVTDCVAASRAPVWQNSTRFRYSVEGLSITGTDALGASWNTTIPASGVFVCEVWSARLTGTSIDDLIVLNYGQSADGFDAELTLLLFDAQKRPVPWRALGHFVSTPRGVQEITTGPSGGALIVVSTKAGDRWDGYAYRSNLYAASAQGLSLVTGPRFRSTWPVLSGKTSLLKGSEHNDVKSVSLNPPEHEPKVKLSDQTRILPPRIVIADHADGTRLIFFAQYVPNGIQHLQKGSFTMQAIGQDCEEDNCHPFLLWGTQK